jgi:hypothetical protein
MKIHALVLGILLLAAPAFAAAVDGKWTGSIETPNGPVQISFTFKADASALTGTITGPDGGEIPLTGGKVDGDNISFSVDLDFGGMPFTLEYKGVVSTDQIKLNRRLHGDALRIRRQEGELGGVPSHRSDGVGDAPAIVSIRPSASFVLTNIPPFEPSLRGRNTTLILSPGLRVVRVQPRRAR